MDNSDANGMAPERRMKAFMLTRYERMGASSRLRLLQYSSALRCEGIENSFGSFFDEEYLIRLYAGQSRFPGTVGAYARRVVQLCSARDFDVVWLEKEALPWLPWIVERSLIPKGVKLVVDYDDAVFHRYDMHRLFLIRWFLANKLDHLMQSAALITAGNHYLAHRAKEAGATRVEIVPTVVDLLTYTRRPEPDPALPVTLGWIGTPTTWVEYISPMMPVLMNAVEEHAARVNFVGAGHLDSTHPQMHYLPWTEASEVARIHEMDIGIMPLNDTPWARGKCGYKLIQYMACGLPVIASPVGVNAEIVEHGVNGFLASTPAEWVEALETLIRDRELRARMGREGRKKVEKDYSLQIWGPRVAHLLRRVADRGLAG